MFDDALKCCLIEDNSGEVGLCGYGVIVMWSCILQLLSKCRREGCGAVVCPDNMIHHRNGKNVVYQ